MQFSKSVILASAASFLGLAGAQAADLPVKAKAVEYVKVCSLYGPGFYYIPGSDTCIKLGGYLRVDVLANTNSDNTGNTSGAGGANNRFTNGYTWRSRQDLNIDTRTATDYGVVRTFFDATFSWTTDSYAGQGNGATVYSPIGTAQAPNNANGGGVAGGSTTPLSSLPASPWARRSRSSLRRGPTTRATTTMVSSAAAVRSPV